MDRIDRAFAQTMRSSSAARTVRRYGVARFRQRVRMHLGAGELLFVRIDQLEPPYIRGVMADVVAKWEFDGHRPFRRYPLSIREENTLFGHPGRMPSRRQQAEVMP